MKTLVVIPTYNEKENIESLLNSAVAAVPADVDFLVVDDNSPDGTSSIVSQCQTVLKRSTDSSDRIFLLKRAGKQGLGTAYVAGFRWGLERGYDALIEMDADFSHHPRYLQEHLRLIQESDFVIGSRYVPGGGTVNWGIGRKILSRCGSFYARCILGAKINDFTGGFNSWKGGVLKTVELDTLRSDGYSFQIELKYRAFAKGFAWKEFPIVFEDRKVGKSKMSGRIILEALLRVWTFRFSQKRV